MYFSIHKKATLVFNVSLNEIFVYCIVIDKSVSLSVTSVAFVKTAIAKAVINGFLRTSTGHFEMA